MISREESSALVIGGASGIGAATVELYRERDIPVTVWDVTGECDMHCDIARPEEIERALGATMAYSGLPRWVTITAGVGHSGLLAEVSPSEWDRVMEINARGPWLCMRAVARELLKAGRTGSMVATSSVSAHIADRNMGIYCASKAALSTLVRVAASEWGPAGIRVNAVAPGVTSTPMLGRASQGSPWLNGVAERTPLGRLGEAGDIAQSILAIHELAWLTGQIIDCDGGLSLHSPIDSYGEVLRTQKGTSR